MEPTHSFWSPAILRSFIPHAARSFGARQQAASSGIFFGKVRKQADGHPIFYFVPNNNYQVGDVFIIALKGSTDFPTWNMARTGPATLNCIGLNITFISEYAFPGGWNEPIPSGALLVWLDLPSLRPVENHYPLLADAKNKAGATYEVTNLPNSAASGHVIRMP
ncbi:hypothetical protein V1282_006915 [Nitrobacteraceae bacterium AZCC 2146]